MSAPVTPRALGAFFTIAEFITLLACVTLIVQDTPLDSIWAIKPNAHSDMLLLRPASTIGFAILTIALGFAAAGCFMRKRWGWTLAVVIFAISGLGDAVRAVQGEALEGGIGLAVALVLLWWLTRPNVRALFAA